MNEMDLGATTTKDASTRFRVWAPKCQSVEICFPDSSTADLPMQPASNGYFERNVPDIAPGTKYQFILNGDLRRPDPASRFQPDGVHGPSAVVDPSAYEWKDQDWKGIAKRDLVIYELHVGTFSKEGTYRGVIRRLAKLVDLGVSAIELMPLAQCPGRWNWGYDGVNPYAPNCNYGSPDDLRALVDACHSLGLAVILDVVYNHLGPEGNYLRDFGPYFSSKHHTPWGEAFNFDGKRPAPVREYVIYNAAYWIQEFHFDGLRLDAVHFMFDDSPTTVLQDIRSRIAELQSDQGRQLHLIAEANVFDESLLVTEGEKTAYDAIWCDCLMHSLYAQALPKLQLAHRVYEGRHELSEVLEFGYLYEAASPPRRVSAVERKPPAATNAFVPSFITGVQTHDSVGNHPQGKRFHQLTSKEYQKAAAALSLLYPSIPQLFMGEEVASETPFPFFVDFEDPRLQRAVEKGRAKEYPQHVWGAMASPTDPATFRIANLDQPAMHDESMFAWYQALLTLRRAGIKQGWLSSENKTVMFDKENSCFQLQYEFASHRIRVLCRLDFSDRESAKSMAVDSTDESVLLSSLPLSNEEQFSLSPVHALVLESSS